MRTLLPQKQHNSAKGIRPRFGWLVGGLMLVSCNDDLWVGSDLIWTAQHESGDLTEWNGDRAGGNVATAGGAVTVSHERPYRGQYSLELVTPGATANARSAAFRTGNLPAQGYYGAWFWVPEDYGELPAWTVMSFQEAAPDPADDPVARLDLQLRSLLGGGYLVTLMDHHPEALLSTIPVPPPRVEARQWFHLQVYLEASAGEGGAEATGRYSVWVNGAVAYDHLHRITPHGPQLEFSVANSVEGPAPGELHLKVDDVAISRSWISPESWLTLGAKDQ